MAAGLITRGYVLASPLVLRGFSANPLPRLASIRDAVESALRADPLVSAFAASIHPGQLPPGAPKPAVVWFCDHIDRQHDLDGPTGRCAAQFTFACISKDIGDDEYLAEAIRQCFGGYTGNLSVPSTGGSIRIHEAIEQDEGDDYLDAGDKTGRGIWDTEVVFTFIYVEPKPSRLG